MSTPLSQLQTVCAPVVQARPTMSLTVPATTLPRRQVSRGCKAGMRHASGLRRAQARPARACSIHGVHAGPVRREVVSGVITAANADGTYDVRYDDKDEAGVSPSSCSRSPTTTRAPRVTPKEGRQTMEVSGDDAPAGHPRRPRAARAGAEAQGQGGRLDDDSFIDDSDESSDEESSDDDGSDRSAQVSSEARRTMAPTKTLSGPRSERPLPRRRPPRRRRRRRRPPRRRPPRSRRRPRRRAPPPRR